MVTIKPMATIASKYTARAAAAQGDYQTAIAATPPAVWETGAKNAADAYAMGVQAALTHGSFARGIDGKGAKWQRRATSLGPQRFAAGVAAAGPDYSAGFQRFHDVLAGLALGPRGPRGDPRNQQRAIQVMTTLNQARVQG